MDEPVAFISKHESHDQAGSALTEPAASTSVAVEQGSLRPGVEEAIDAIRPALQMDGGDVTLVGVDESTGVVEIELIGACVGCPASTMTLKAGIERILKDRVPGITEVNAIGLEPAFDF